MPLPPIPLPAFLRLASDATLFGLAAGVLLALSALALWGERRRLRRSEIDAVGLMPWRDIAAMTSFVGAVLLGMAVLGWLK